jgi:hypothetical protein
MRGAGVFAGGWLGLAMLGCVEAAAHGALAVGLPDNVAKSGVAMGRSWNHETAESARNEALDRCLSEKNASIEARKLCEIVREFEDECVALAMDPKDGTPGVGWAIAKSEADAEKAAMKKCKSTAGRERQEFCKLFTTRCDGK